MAQHQDRNQSGTPVSHMRIRRRQWDRATQLQLTISHLSIKRRQGTTRLLINAGYVKKMDTGHEGAKEGEGSSATDAGIQELFLQRI